MKKFLLGAGLLLFILAIIDTTLLKEKGLINQADQLNEYRKIDKPEELPVGLEVENLAPSFQLTNLDGKQVSLEDYKGKKVLLNFWASWCPPCKAEMPDMEKLYTKSKSEDVIVLAVNLTNTEKSFENVGAFVEEKQLTFPILLDEKGEVASQYNVMSYPTSYFIDRDGVIRNKVMGAVNEDYMNREMNKMP